MRSVIRNLALIENNNHIACLYCAYSMGNHDNSLLSAERIYGSHDILFG